MLAHVGLILANVVLIRSKAKDEGLKSVHSVDYDDENDEHIDCPLVN